MLIVALSRKVLSICLWCASGMGGSKFIAFHKKYYKWVFLFVCGITFLSCSISILSCFWDLVLLTHYTNLQKRLLQFCAWSYTWWVWNFSVGSQWRHVVLPTTHGDWLAVRVRSKGRLSSSPSYSVHLILTMQRPAPKTHQLTLESVNFSNF